VFKRQDGTSHRIYQHPDLGRDGFMNFQSVQGKAKPYQVRQLLKAIESQASAEGENEQL
jgi:hypothetical protein